MDVPVPLNSVDAPASVVIPTGNTWYLPRSRHLPLLFLFPTSFCGLSWMAGGLPGLTDIGFLLLTVICVSLLIRELIVFPRRFGLGSIILFGGYTVWFCYDYLMNWLGAPFDDLRFPLTKEVIAKAAFYHCLFAFFASIGLTMTNPRRTPALMARLPEAKVQFTYFMIAVVCFLIGILPYFLFTQTSGFEAIYLSIFSGRSAQGPQWLIGRTGNANYNWGGYIVHVLQTGQVGAQLAAFYALMISRSVVTKSICWSMWALHVALAFGTGSRGEVIFMALPVCAILFLKHQVWAASMLKRISLRAYILSGAALLVILLVVQIQIRYRNLGFSDVNLEEVTLTNIHGNNMFSEGLTGWGLIPDHHPFIQSRFIGESLVRPLPEAAWRFVLHGIPRALWPSKPFDPLFQWHNSVKTGRDIGNTEGTTISTGLVGDWYMRYGFLGVIEGAWLFGWLCRVCERSLMLTISRPFGLLMSIGLAVILFRFYRNFTYQLVYPVLLPGIVMALLIVFLNLFSARSVGVEARS